MAHRGTGCGLTLACGRVASLSSPFTATYSDMTTSVQVWIMFGIYALIAVVAGILHFEPQRYTVEGEA